jgi:hypothetical protein
VPSNDSHHLIRALHLDPKTQHPETWHPHMLQLSIVV